MPRTKLLLTTVFGPYGIKNKYAEGLGMQMELFNNQITREQGVHSPRANYWTFPLYFLAENLSSLPTTVLDFPTWKGYIRELKREYSHVGISFTQQNVLKAKRMAEYIRQNYPQTKIILGGYGTMLPDLADIVPYDEICHGEGVRWLREYFGENPEAPIKHPLLFWSIDYTRVPAEMQCDFLDLSQHNKLAKQEKRILGKRVELSKITYPVYLMAGTTDHITPWKACYRSTQLFGGDVTFVLTNQNHTQTISGRLDNRHLRYWIPKELPADPEAALRTADEHAGSWTFHWIDWLNARYEEPVPAPKKLGSKKHPAIAPAPGQYVLES